MSEFRRRLMMGGTGSNPWDRYVIDGLIFQLDCETECTSELWTDIRGGIQLVGNGIAIVDNGVKMNGLAYTGEQFPYHEPRESMTMEICYKEVQPSARYIIMMTGFRGSYLFSKYDNNFVFASGNVGDSTCWRADTDDLTNVTSISVSGQQVCLHNMIEVQPTISDYFGEGTEISIGARQNNTYPFNGYLYSLRMYNRVLTKSEMLANQAIDLQRFKNI